LAKNIIVNQDISRILIFSIIMIALGIVFNTGMAASTGSLGTIFIAIGCFFLIVAMARKREQDKKNKSGY